MTDRVERIKACLNGRRSKDEHPSVPVVPAELAGEAAAAVRAGAEAVHLHARGRDGAESVAPADVAAAVAAVRAACPGTPIGVSTGLWITGGDEAARRAAVAAWAGLPPAGRPDFASVNVAEPGAAAVVGALDAAGIMPEAGVWSVADVRALGQISPARGWLRIMVEIIGWTAADAVAEADRILRELGAPGASAPLLLHGEGETCWPLIRRAGRLGLATRAGLEDVTTGPDGQPVGGNGELTSLALTLWSAAACPPLGP
jgi:uncharacterized protein (DUF849 family)